LEEDDRILWLSRVSLLPFGLLIFSSRWARLLTSISILCAQFVEIFLRLTGFHFICLLFAFAWLILGFCCSYFEAFEIRWLKKIDLH
jgi:hypothetical protein